MQLLEKPREPPLETVLVDTAGQIEIFTWSASGTIITDVLASSLPTVIVYVVDTTRCMNPQTFMSNMMQACSILYKTRLPLVLVGCPLCPVLGKHDRCSSKIGARLKAFPSIVARHIKSKYVSVEAPSTDTYFDLMCLKAY
jgi:hypothetical protein